MPTINFLPQNIKIEAETNSKLLVTANRNKIPLRFGCAACRCGTCGVKLETNNPDNLSPMRDNEKKLLARMQLPIDGSVRLACQTRVLAGHVTVDLDFQNTYSADDGDR